MYIYIAYRDLRTHYSQNNGFGGVPFNNDYKFTCINGGSAYLLTLNGANYPVSKKDGDKFIEDVLSKCTGEHRGFFPFVPSINGKETAAVIEQTREVNNGRFTIKRDFYYDMDDEVLFNMLEDLRSRSGEPLDERALMNYCYPNPTLPEGDFDLKEIYHGIYCKPEKSPAAVIQTSFPDKKISSLKISGNEALLQMRVDNNEMTGKVPAELIPEIKEKVRQLCRDPKEAFVEHGNWEGYIRFGNDDERIFTDPNKTLELLKEIASKSGSERSEEVDTQKYRPVYAVPDGIFPGMIMTGTSGSVNVPSANMPFAPAVTPDGNAQSPVSDGTRCIFCGADVTGKKFCTECGGKVG